MQKIILFSLTCFLMLSCLKTKRSLIDGIYYNKVQRELMVIKENGKIQEIYNIILMTTHEKKSLKYKCIECPNEETILQINQIDNENIKVEAAFKDADINGVLFQKLDDKSCKWDSIKICTAVKCKSIKNNKSNKQYLYDKNTPFSLSEEIDISANHNFIFYSDVTDAVPVDIIFYLKNKDKFVRNTLGLHSYLCNLRYIANICLSKEVSEEKKLNCDF